jgi:putative DNA-invertase from lambdoid prophage Rac
MVQAIKRVAIYCRVSTSDQNCDRQQRDLEAFAQRAGFEIVSIYKETASGMKNDRAKRRQILQLAQARQIDGVLVTEMSRWGRSLQDLISTMNELNAFGVSLIAEKGFQFDLSTPQGKMLAGILGSLAEFERDLIAERVRSGMSVAKARGKHVGRPAIKTSDKYAKKVMGYLTDGRTIRWIAKELHISKTTVMAIKQRVAA